MRTLTEKINERINSLREEDYKLILYCIIFMISWKLDEFYCNALAKYYGCQVGDTLYYDKTIGMLLISLVFGIVDLILSYRIWKIAHKSAMEITITNGILTSIKGVKKLLEFPAMYVILISTVSILYDICSFF